MDKKALQFDTESERADFKNQLINDQTISKFIESSFNGNILFLGPLDENRAAQHWKTQEYVEDLVSNKRKVMTKLHKLSYGDYFGTNF